MSAVNLNVGLLGHIDSGKTTLAKALSDTASTAAFDKHPQSRDRGITLDLGFSSYTIPLPDHLKVSTNTGAEYDRLQYTLVDCPGHASLLKTIIAGTQIIDLVLLVVDATKGIQTQTAECLVVCEITGKNVIVVMNKIDLIDVEKRASALEKGTKRVHSMLSKTPYVDAPFVYISASESIGIKEAIETIACHSTIPDRRSDGPFHLFVDHCFQIKGHGTVMTGTVLNGSVSLNDMIEIPRLNVTKRVKSLQAFRRPIRRARQGDRIGVCVGQFDAQSQVERAIVCTPSCAKRVKCTIVRLKPIAYHKEPIRTNGKYHVTFGHETIVGTITLFLDRRVQSDSFDATIEYEYVDRLPDEPCVSYAIIELDRPAIIVTDNDLLIGCKLDAVAATGCRIAFSGHVASFTTDLHGYKESYLQSLRIFKRKTRRGFVERRLADNGRAAIIVRNMFGKTNDLHGFLGFKVRLADGETGRIVGAFGKSGKVKVAIDYNEKRADDGDGAEAKPTDDSNKNEAILTFKRYVFDPEKKMYQ